jgi:hypothetical protein
MWTPFPKDAILLSLLYLDRISRLPPSLSPINETSIEMVYQPTPLFPNSKSRRPSLISTFSTLPPCSSTTILQAIDPPPSAHIPTVPIINSYTFHRLLAASLSLASKFIADAYISMSRASKVAGVTKKELPRLEIECLKLLEWSLRFNLADVEEIAGVIVHYKKKEGVEVEEERQGGSVAREERPVDLVVRRKDLASRLMENETIESTPASSVPSSISPNSNGSPASSVDERSVPDDCTKIQDGEVGGSPGRQSLSRETVQSEVV